MSGFGGRSNFGGRGRGRGRFHQQQQQHGGQQGGPQGQADVPVHKVCGFNAKGQCTRGDCRL